jgi:glutamate-5-semialdehyde dehydrogenase
MTASLKAIDGNADLPALMTELASRARAAARVLALAPPEQKNRALDAIERAIRNHAPAILAANAEDVAEARASGGTSAFIDRLTLTEARINAMADGVATVRKIPDPIGSITESWQRPNGMTIERVRVRRSASSLHLESPPRTLPPAPACFAKSGAARPARRLGGSTPAARSRGCWCKGFAAGCESVDARWFRRATALRSRSALNRILTGGVGVIVCARGPRPRHGSKRKRACRCSRSKASSHVYVDHRQISGWRRRSPPMPDATARRLRHRRDLADRSFRGCNQPQRWSGC